MAKAPECKQCGAPMGRLTRFELPDDIRPREVHKCGRCKVQLLLFGAADATVRVWPHERPPGESLVAYVTRVRT